MSVSNANASLTLNPARAEDIRWLDPLYEELMRPSVELTHAWDPAGFRERYDPAHSWIIRYTGVEIGFLSWEIRPNYIYLNDIQIRREYQGRGIGTALIHYVIDQGEQHRLMVRLRVLKGNPAKALYLRLGFRVDAELDNCWELVRP